MKVKKSSNKKIGTVHPDLDGLIKKLLDTPKEQLITVIRDVIPHDSPWSYPRGDMYHWAPVLDKFDEILEVIVKEYKIDEVQTKPFAEDDKNMILEIARVQRLLMENVTSRKMFASYDRYSALLFTSDMDVLQAALTFLLRPAQQYSSHTTFELNENAVIKSRLQLLATGGGVWNLLKENGWDIVKLAKLVDRKGEAMDDDTELNLPDSFFQIQAKFYRTNRTGDDVPHIAADTKELVQPTSELRLGSQEQTPLSPPKATTEEATSQDPFKTPIKRQQSSSKTAQKGRVATLAGAEPSTPQAPAVSSSTAAVTTSSFSRAYTNTDGLTELTIPPTNFMPLVRSREKTSADILTELISSHPELQGEEGRHVQFDLLSRLRCIMAVGTKDGSLNASIKEGIRKAIDIRLTALAVWIHLVTEDVAQTEYFLYEPTIITQLAELVQPTTSIGDATITPALWVLDACARFRTKIGEVLNSLNANVAHGTLMTFFRDLIKRLGTHDHVPHLLVDATLSFVSFAASAPHFGNMLIGAGIIPTLIELIKVTIPRRGGYVARAIGLVDSINYANTNAFGMFLNAGGLEVLNARIVTELDRHLSDEAMSEQISETEVVRRTVPLKLMLRSIHRLMTTGGNAEGLRNLIDSQLPKSLLRALQNANRLGTPVLAITINITATFIHNEPTSLSIIQEMKLPEAIYDALENNNNPSYEVIATIPYALGALCLNQAGTDYALSRPRLIHLLVNSPSNLAYREVLRERENAMYLGSSLDELVRHHPALKPVLHEALRDMLRNVAAMGQVGRFAGVSKVSDYKLIPDSLQRSAEEKDETPSLTEDLELPSAPDGTEKNMDVVITLTAQLMCGLFQNPQFAKDFLEQGGLSLVLNLYELPCLVSQFATTDTARHLNNVLRNLAQAELAKVLEGIIEAVRTAMAQVSFIWKRDLDTSGVISLGLLHPKSANDLESANTQFRRLAYLNNLLGLLGTFYHSASYALGKIAATFLQVLGASKSSIFLSNLGKLHRVCLLENIWCKCNESPQRPKPASISKTQSLEEAVLSPMVEFSASDLALSHTSSDSIGHPTDAVVKNPISDQTVDASKMPENYSSVRYMFSRIPLHIMPIFQGIIRLLQLRKADPAHKAHSVPTADLVAAIMVEHLESAANLPKTIEAGGYAFTITGLISSYLCGDPNGNGTLQTMLLIAFQKKGGIIALRSRLQQQLDSIGAERRAILELSSKDAPTLLRAFAGIKVIFDLVKTLVSAEALQKAPQTLTLISKDKEPDHEDYFSPLELLIKIRLDLADPIWATFQAAWLQDCPLAIVQAVSKAALSLAQPVSALASYFASGSDATPASSTGTAGTLSSTLATLGFPTSRSSRSDGQADSTYSDMLVDMGFSRGAANAALISCGNVFPSAAYYVIQHGHVLDQMQLDGGSIESASATASTNDQSGPPAVGTGETAPSAIPASTSPKVALKAVAAGRKSHLEQRQKKYLAALPTRAVELIEAHNELSFIFGPALLDVQGAVDVIMQGIKELQPDATNRDVKLQARLQLFAILAHQPTFGASLDRTKAIEYVDVLQNLLGSTATPRPRWVAANLLAMECIIMWGSESIELQPSGDSIPETIRTGPLHKVVRSRLLNYCTSLLQEKDLSEDELLAVLRSLVFLTRDKELLRPFLEQSGLHSLFQSVYSTPLKRRHAGMALSTIICRHFAEDGAVLQQCMQREIQAWFSKPRTTPTTAKHFVSNLRAVALRDPDVFLRAAKEECKLVSPEPRAGNYSITLQSKEEGKIDPTVEPAQPEVASTEPSSAMQVDDPFQAVEETGSRATSSLQQVMKHLIAEVLNLAKDRPIEGEDVSAAGSLSLENRLSPVLLILVELLGSYNESKAIMLQPAKRSGKDSAISVKTRSPVLNVLLNHYVCNIVFDADVNRNSGDKVTDAQKERMNVSNWAGAVIVALCSDPSGNSNLRDPTNPIVTVRKTVMDAIAKSIKDASSSTDPLNLRYGRLWALSELCYRLLTARPAIMPKHYDDPSLHIAKIMLEKGFVPLLTAALAEVDLTYPRVKNLITAVVQPLEYLTKMSKKMARPERMKPINSDHSEDESMSSDSDSEDNGAEDTEILDEARDMYRNSSLGMFGGEMDDYEDDSEEGDGDDDDDLEHYEEVEEMDDESSDGTASSSDDEDTEEELEQWDADLAEDDDIEGEEAFPNEDENDEPVEFQFDDDMEPFDQGAIEMAANEDGPEYEIGEEYLEEMDEMEDDERSESYDEEEELDALDTVVVDPLTASSSSGPTLNWGWGQPVRTQTRENTHIQNRLRRESHMMESMFTSTHAHPHQPSVASIVSHPLLQPEPTATTASDTRPSLGARPRGHGGLDGVLQSIERLLGERDQTAHVLDQLLASTGGQRPDVIRISYDEGHGVGGVEAVDIQINNHRAHRAHRHTEASTQPDTDDFSSVPLALLNRWQEEESLLHTFDPTTRINNISAWLVHMLLPAAKKVDDERKERLAVEETKRKQEDEEANRQKAEQERLRLEAEEESKRQEAEAAERRVLEVAAAAGHPDQSNDQDIVMADSESAPNAGAEDADSAASAPRITVMIHGAEVDITETGIDPEFLEALPEDMRADVVAQHLRESRAAAAQTQPAASTEISPEFLDALPPDIRAEVIQQEAIEAARRNAESRSTAASAGHGSQVAELGDYQGFLNTLDPAIRQVLQDQEGGFLAGLPSHFVPSALSRQMATGTRRLGSSTRPHDDPVASHNALANPQPAIPKKAPPRETIQLLDKSGIAALIRLLFFPGISKKNNLLKVLANLCENTKGRGDVINLLLGVLQDDSGDLSYVDRQTASRLTKGVAGTPKATPKKKPTPDTPSSSAVMLSQMQSESVPTFVAQRAFEALVHIVNSNEQALAYFLTEQEIFSATKSNTKKGKGREKPVFQTYPIVVLLKLLDRPSLFRTPGMVETLTALLSTLTKPLAHLPKASKVSLEDVPTTGSDPEGDSIAIADLAEPAATGPASGSIPAVQPAGADSAAVQPSDIDTERETTDSLIKTPPVIPDEILRLVPNVLTHGECSSRTFSSTLGMIQNLTFIPSAKETISAQLQDHAQRLGDGLNADLAQLQVDLLQAETSATEREVPVGRFSPASSSQTKLLRVLKTIDYIHSPKDGVNPSSWDAAAITSVAEGTKELTAEEERAEHIFDSMHFAPLWEALGQCLTVIERKEFLMPIATVLLPLVESLMVVSKYGSAKAAATRGRTGSAAMSPMSPKDLPEEEPFVAFTSRHRKILNTMVRNNPSLMSGSFSLLILNPRVLEFDNKRNWFMQQLRKKPNRDVGGNIHLNVRRQYVFDDSYRALQNKSGESLKYGKLNVKFYDEEGVDAGGVTREWYSVLAQSIFNPGYCLFEPCAADEGTYQPSQHSWVNPDHLGYFRFIGKIIGKAIHDQRLLDAYFSRAFYKQILGRKVDVRDLESVDPEYHKSLVWMLNNDITGIIELDFSLETEEFGAKKVIDLKEGGSQIPVTEENKEEYVRLVVEHRLETSIQNQAKAFLEGFYDVIPRKLVTVFDPDQLELLISGVSNIDVDELKNSTQLHGWKNSDAEITWFWRALRSFSQEEKAKFLMFVTSSSRVPLGGFTQLQGSTGIQPFQIHKLYRENVLPSSATCFNELLLPSYPSYEDLRSKLMTAISEGAGHFGHA